MKLKKTFILFLLFAFLFAFFVHWWFARQRLPDYSKVQVNIKGKAYTLYLADTAEKRIKGLSNVVSLKKNEGMLFLFDKPDYYSFWMKNMHFPIDLIFVKDKTTVDIFANIRPESYSKSFITKEPANRVIELNAGEVEKLGLSVGDEVLLP